MRVRILLGALIVLVFATRARAQLSLLSAPGAGVHSNVMQGWRARLGDDPAFASRDFDDSAWMTVDLDRLYSTSPLAVGRSRWFRKRITLPDGAGPLDLVLYGMDGAFEVYVDGHLVSGPLRTSFVWRKGVTHIYPLRTAEEAKLREVEVAVRSHLYAQPFVESEWPEFVDVADPDMAAAIQTARNGRVLGGTIFALAVNLVLVVAGALLLTLYLQQRGRREYLWLGISLICSGFSGAGVPAELYLPITVNAFFGDPCTYWVIAAQVEFVYVFLGIKPRRAVRAYQFALIFCPYVILPVVWSGLFDPSIYVWIENGAILPGMFLMLGVLIHSVRRGGREAGLLLGPMLLSSIGGFVFDAEIAVRYIWPSYSGIPAWNLGLLSITIWPATQAIYLLGVGLVIFLRFVRVSQEQMKTKAELEAARAIQQVLIPEALPSVQGFSIGSAYQPAQQVGGDFFQMLSTNHSGVLAVIGDVSGKGMPAAMTVSLLVGTFRTLAHYTQSPGEILAAMNQRMLSRSGGGFTSCLVVRVDADGTLTAANAGHIAPYLDGKELVLKNGLPLGLDGGETYPESTFNLSSDAWLTLLTDGVVEARNKAGELFGFDRTAKISTQSAESIAQAALSFGQEDDITVLTLTPMPVEFTHT
jgi:Stage II sporulation protein E (SpoIIE)